MHVLATFSFFYLLPLHISHKFKLLCRYGSLETRTRGQQAYFTLREVKSQ